VSAPITKLSKLVAAANAGDWQKAISIASKFGELGAEKTAIMQAREAYVRPDFQRQLGRCPKQLIAAGIAALRGRYHV